MPLPSLPPPPPGEPEHRGTEGTPAEGRRFYDREDVRIEEALMQMGGAFRRTRLWVGMGTLVLTIIMGSLTWFGWEGTGPGRRVELLSQKVDANFTQLTNRDSMTSVRLERLERVVSTMAYQSCMGGKNANGAQCARIFENEP